VLVLRGQGGIGKTSLAVKLMEACGIEPLTLAPSESCAYDNALFFKVGDSDGFDALVASFLNAFGLGESHDQNTTPAQTIARILARFQQERWLVVIDNLESLMEKDYAYVKSADVSTLLNSFATVVHQSQIVITSRKFPDDLNDRRGRSFDIGVVADRLIPGISTDASIELLEKLKAKDSPADLKWMAERVGGNVFILKCLAHYSIQKPGILRKKPELVTQEAKPIVLAQWELQGVPAQELLQRMCVLRMAMNIPALTTLRLLKSNSTAIASTPEAVAATEDLLTGLVKSDLVQDLYDELLCESRYILHPLMAETLQDIFAADLGQLWKYSARLYSSFDLPENEKFLSFEDMRFVLEKLHFYWLLGQDRRGVMKMVVSDILPKLKKWCYWDLSEEWVNKCLEVQTESTELEDRAGIATSWSHLGDIARKRGYYTKAKEFFRQSLSIRTELNNRAGMATSLNQLGDIARLRGDYTEAEELYNESLTIVTELNNRARIATSWSHLGDIAFLRGGYTEAEKLYNESLSIRTELNNRSGMATSLNQLGDIARKRGDYTEAEKLFQESLSIRTELNNRTGMANSLCLLGDIARKRGDYTEAEELYNKSLTIVTELNHRERIAVCWGCLGENELEKGANLTAAEEWLSKALFVMKELYRPEKIAELHWDFARLYQARGDELIAQDYYKTSHKLYTEIGAKGKLEAIESEWH
jgi:tetratricopeptide (TPR) repeat protein